MSREMERPRRLNAGLELLENSFGGIPCLSGPALGEQRSILREANYRRILTQVLYASQVFSLGLDT